MHVVHSLQGDDTAADPFDEDPDNILVVGYMIDVSYFSKCSLHFKKQSSHFLFSFVDSRPR